MHAAFRAAMLIGCCLWARTPTAWPIHVFRSIGAGAGSVCTPPSPLLPMLDTRNPYATGAVKDAVRMITTSSEYHSYKSSPGCPATAAEPPPTEVPVIGSVQVPA